MNEDDLRAKGLIKLGDGSWSRRPKLGAVAPAVSDSVTKPAPRKALVSVHGVPQGSPGRIVVRYTLYRCRPLDESNAAASIKALEDALRYAGILPEDSPEIVQLIVEQEKVSHKEQEGTKVKITFP